MIAVLNFNQVETRRHENKEVAPWQAWCVLYCDNLNDINAIKFNAVFYQTCIAKQEEQLILSDNIFRLLSSA